MGTSYSEVIGLKSGFGERIPRPRSLFYTQCSFAEVGSTFCWLRCHLPGCHAERSAPHAEGPVMSFAPEGESEGSAWTRLSGLSRVYPQALQCVLNRGAVPLGKAPDSWSCHIGGGSRCHDLHNPRVVSSCLCAVSSCHFCWTLYRILLSCLKVLMLSLRVISPSWYCCQSSYLALLLCLCCGSCRISYHVLVTFPHAMSLCHVFCWRVHSGPIRCIEGAV